VSIKPRLGTFLPIISVGKSTLYVNTLRDKNQLVRYASDYGLVISAVVGTHGVWRIWLVADTDMNDAACCLCLPAHVSDWTGLSLPCTSQMGQREDVSPAILLAASACQLTFRTGLCSLCHVLARWGNVRMFRRQTNGGAGPRGPGVGATNTHFLLPLKEDRSMDLETKIHGTRIAVSSFMPTIHTSKPSTITG
jgi:hypothetical protein